MASTALSANSGFSPIIRLSDRTGISNCVATARPAGSVTATLSAAFNGTVTSGSRPNTNGSCVRPSASVAGMAIARSTGT